MRTSLAASAAAAVAALVGLSMWIDAGLEHGRAGWGELILVGGLALAIAGVGLLVAVRAVPAIGWLLLGLAMTVSADLLAPRVVQGELIHAGDIPSLGARLLLAIPWWALTFLSLALVALLFPDGRLPSRRWRPALIAVVSGSAALVANDLLDPHPFDAPFSALPGLTSRAPAWLTWPLGAFALVAFGGGLVLSVAGLVVRFRRANGLERLQLQWLAWAASLLPLTFFACLGSVLLAGEFNDAVLGGFFVGLLVSWVGAIAIALTRYRLYEIERIVNRTLVYGSVSVVLLAGWIVVALVVGAAAGRDSTWLAAGLGAAAAVLFRPLRDRAQTIVDRRFNRRRYEGLRLVRTFEQDVRDGRSEPEGIGRVIGAALNDPGCEILFLLPATGVHVDAKGNVREPPGRDTPSSAVELKGEPIGVLLHRPELADHPYLVSSVLSEGALAIELARLRLELKAQLEEVERSRARILQAGYEERRRLERDLHDGAQQRLVSLGITLRRTQRSLPREARVLRPALDAAVDEIGRAVSDLRTLAGGIRPARLDEGLAAALADLARSAPLPVEVDVPGERLPADVEAAAYFTACEAVTNAVKHASPSRVWVHARREEGTLSLLVRDDGVGGARPGVGSGLVGLEDRVRAHRGRFTIDSPPGGGTRIEVELPCGS